MLVAWGLNDNHFHLALGHPLGPATLEIFLQHVGGCGYRGGGGRG